MAYPSVTYTFTNGTTASATEVNQNFTDLINGLSDGTKDLSISALTVAGTASLNGAVNIGNATSDDIAVNGYITTALIPKADDSYDLGTAALAWQDAYFDGKVYTDTISELTSAAGVTIDGVKLKDNNIEATTSGGLSINDDGGNVCFTAVDGGDAVLGEANKNIVTKRNYSGAYSIIGNPTSQSFSVANGGTATFRLGFTNAGGLFIIGDSNGFNSVWFYDFGSSTFTRIAGNTNHVAGAPASTQIGLSYAATNAAVTVTAGAFGGRSLFVFVLGTYI